MIYASRFILLTCLLLSLLSTKAQQPFPYIVPTHQVLKDSGIAQIEVFVQHLEDLPNWETRVVRNAEDVVVGSPIHEYTYFINSLGAVDSMVKWSQEGQPILSIGLDYDDSGRLIRIVDYDSERQRSQVQSFTHKDGYIFFERKVYDRWVRKTKTDEDSIILKDHFRNQTDSGYWEYDPVKESVDGIAYTAGRLAYRNHMHFIMKDGVPDSLYVKNDWYESAFGIVRIEGATDHVEGEVDLIYTHEAVVPEHSPLYGTIQTGYAFGDHRSKIRLPEFIHDKLFIADSLIRETDIWPTFHPTGGSSRKYYLIEYK